MAAEGQSSAVVETKLKTGTDGRTDSETDIDRQTDRHSRRKKEKKTNVLNICGKVESVRMRS